MRSFPWVLTIMLLAGCAAGGVGEPPADDAHTDVAADTDAAPPVIVTCTGQAGDTDGATDTDTDTGADTGADTDADTGATDTDTDTDTDPSPVCGDGQITSPEACDDRYDIVPYDGCTGCQVDNGWWCYGEPSYCVVL